MHIGISKIDTLCVTVPLSYNLLAKCIHKDQRMDLNDLMAKSSLSRGADITGFASPPPPTPPPPSHPPRSLLHYRSIALSGHRVRAGGGGKRGGGEERRLKRCRICTR
jgi:hypothetical protein